MSDARSLKAKLPFIPTSIALALVMSISSVAAGDVDLDRNNFPANNVECRGDVMTALEDIRPDLNKFQMIKKAADFCEPSLARSVLPDETEACIASAAEAFASEQFSHISRVQRAAMALEICGSTYDANTTIDARKGLSHEA